MERHEAQEELVNTWTELDDDFDGNQRLREMRSLVAKGAVSQEAYERLHQHVLEKNMSEKERLKAIKQRGKEFKPKDVSEKPLIEGHLYKRSMTGKKTWRKRYFRLFSDRLEYAHKRTDAEPAGRVLLNKNWYAADSILKRLKNTRKNGFMMSDFSETVYLAAETPEDKTYWMHTIAKVLRKLKEDAEAIDAPTPLGAPAGKPRPKSLEPIRRRAEHEPRRLHSVSAAARGAARASMRAASEPAARVVLRPRALSEQSRDAEADFAEEDEDGDDEDSEQGEQGEADQEPEPGRKPTGRISLPDARSRSSTRSRISAAAQSRASLRSHASAVRHASARASTSSIASLPKTLSNTVASERSSKAKSLTELAMAAHDSARESVRSNLGLDVMSFAEQEALREQAADAERVKLQKDIENEAAMAELERVELEQEALKAELRAARTAGDEAKQQELEPTYRETKDRLREVEELAVRTAAEREEADEVAQETEEALASASAANQIVLELAKVDRAILHAEQIADNAEAARARAKGAAVAVKAQAEREAAETSAKLAEAEKRAAEAVQEEAERVRQEQLLLQRLQETAAKKVGEKQRRKVEELAARAAKVREEAEALRFEAELEATRLEGERLDAMSKAAAVEKALRETRLIVEERRAVHGLDPYSFAAPRAAKTAEHEREVAARKPAVNKEAAKAKRKSFVNRVGNIARKSLPRAPARPARPARKGLSQEQQKQQQRRKEEEERRRREEARREREREERQRERERERERERQAPVRSARGRDRAAAAAAAADQQGPMEAASAFMSYFQSFTTAAVEGLEYVTGFRLMEDDEETVMTLETLETLDRYEDRYEDLLSDTDYDSSGSELDAEFDERLQRVGEHERRQAAAAWIEFEMNRLLEVIHEVGSEDSYGRDVVTFGELLDVYEDISDTLVGILLRAKQAGKVHYRGDMLFEIEHDDVEITALE